MSDPDQRLAAWRQQGADRIDPLRFRLIEAMARRATAYDVATRRVLDERLAALLAAYGDQVDAAAVAVAVTEVAAHADAHGAQAGEPHPEGEAAIATERRSALGRLVAEAAARAPRADDAVAPTQLRYFRAMWSRLSADRRLTQSRAKLPENAGPLNSQQLVHRALMLMHELSPEYLHRFMSYVDTLSWIEREQAARATQGAQAAQAAKRPAPRRRR